MNKGIEITLPVIKSSRIFGKVVKRSYGEEKFLLDMSLAAEERFEQKFPTECKAYGDLQQFMERVNSYEDLTRAKVLSMLKCLYCWFETKYAFIEFLQLFDLTDINYIGRLVEKLRLTFGIIMENASEKN